MSAQDWKAKLYQVTNKYPLSNQFNADEMGLFDRQIPRKSLIRKGKNVNVGNNPRKD
jgi:hypothetical protein